MSLIKDRSSIVRSKVKEEKELFFNSVKPVCGAKENGPVGYYIKQMKNYVARSFRKEIRSTYIRQLILFSKSKFQERYLSPITGLVEKAYNKKAEFNLVNLKYPYLNSDIFSEVLGTKLKNRENNVLEVLSAALLTFTLTALDAETLYDQMFIKKRYIQNTRVDDLIGYLMDTDAHNSEDTNYNDPLNILLSRVGRDGVITNIQHNNTHSFEKASYPGYASHTINTVVKGIKNKFVSGVRLETAGRLTRRYTAARSLFKLRYIGNIRDMDSSLKGLPAVLLRGYLKASLQYSMFISKKRIGSFGLKA